MPEGTLRSPARTRAFLRASHFSGTLVVAMPPLYPQAEERFRNGVESGLCAVARRSDHRAKKRRNYKFCGEMGSAGLIQVRELRKPRSGLGQFPAFP